MSNVGDRFGSPESTDKSKKAISEYLRADSGCFSGSNLFSNSSLSQEIEPTSSSIGNRDYDGSNKRDEGYDKGYSSTLDSGLDISECMSSLNLTSDPSSIEQRGTEPTTTVAPTKRMILLPAPTTSTLSANTDSGVNTSPSPLAQLGLSPAHINILKEIFRSDDDGDTQLHIAVMRGFVEVVWHITRLIPHQALLDLPNNSGRTALHLAVASGDAHVARHLIVCGASPVARDRTGSTPLHLSCRVGDVTMVTELTRPVTVAEVIYARLMFPPNHVAGLLAADLNDYDGQTCIHLASQGSHMDILQHLTWYGADVNAKDGKCGRTALHYAVESRDPNLVSFLFGSCRAALNVTSYAGLTPYQLALANDAPAIASLLAELGAANEPAPAPQEEDIDLEEIPSNFTEDGETWGLDDLRINSIPVSNAIAVSTQGPLNMDLYM